MAGRPYTYKEVDRIGAMILDGVSYREISALTGRSYSAVNSFAHGHGYAFPRDKQTHEIGIECLKGRCCKEIAAMFGIKESQVLEARKRLRRKGLKLPPWKTGPRPKAGAT